MIDQRIGFVCKASFLAVAVGIVGSGALSPASDAASTDFSTIAVVRDGGLSVGPPNDLASLDLPAPAGDVALSANGDRLAVAVGIPIRTYMEGIRGQVHVLDADTGALVELTSLAPSVITGVAIDAAGDHVAFVKDYRELWLFDAGTGESTQLADTELIAPHVRGGAIFDPAFTAAGDEVLFGVVEETFQGEDDRLDNLWSVGVGGEPGEPRRLTSLEAPSSEEGWTIVRNPVGLPDASTLMALATDNVWSVAQVADDVETLGPVPPATVPVAATSDEMLFLSMNMQTLKFNLVVLELPSDGEAWEHWCELGCTTIARNVSAAAGATLP
ncbi:MAG: hypothetical protein M3134_00670 [Actinomycetota bacterium]|nr:hypothetical protein [Actinomycetota bacterium]